MNIQDTLKNVSLEEASVIISNALIKEKSTLEEQKFQLQEKKKKYEQDYINANTGDSSENAPLDEAKKNLKTITGEIANNAIILQAMQNLEDVYYLVRTFDFTELKDAVKRLSESSYNKFVELFNISSIDDISNSLVDMDVDSLAVAVDEFSEWIHANKNEQAETQCLWKLLAYYKVANKPPYNYCGRVKIYSTVKLQLDDEVMVYRIYPEGLSFIDIGIIAANSRVAQALIDKSKGDTITLQHASERTRLEYKILDIY